MKVFFAIIVAYLMLDGAFGKKRHKKPPPPMNRKQKFNVLFQTINDLQQNVSALWARIDQLSQMESRGSGGVHIHASDGHVEHHHNNEEGQHLHMHMHVDSDCEHSAHDEEGEMHERMHAHGRHQEFTHAHCEMMPNSQNPQDFMSIVRGKVHLRQKIHGGQIHVDVHLRGFDVSGDHAHHVHGFHIHEFGDLSEGCNSLGGHYDVTGNPHGAPDAEIRHTGDWGNIMCNDEGVVDKHFTDEMASLTGRNSIIGRSIVIHQRHDDMGVMDTPASRSSGDAGRRIACCVIGRSMSHDLSHERVDGGTESESHVSVETESESHIHP